MAQLKIAVSGRRHIRPLAHRIIGPVLDRAARIHAKLLVRKYGDAAAKRAFDRAQVQAALGDYWGREMWLKVGRSVVKLNEEKSCLVSKKS